MNDFNLGYNWYLQGKALAPHHSKAFRRGYYAAERDAYSYWYSLSEKEMAQLGDKWQEGNLGNG